MPKATPRDIAASIKAYDVRTSASGEVRGAGQAPAETPEYVKRREAYWTTLRKLVASGRRFPDDRRKSSYIRKKRSI